MEYRVELTDRAKRDLTDLYLRFSATESTTVARWFNGLEKAVYSLASLPRRCPIAPESMPSGKQLRHLLYGKKPHIYRAIYRIDERRKTVFILTIRHGAMDYAGSTALNTGGLS